MKYKNQVLACQLILVILGAGCFSFAEEEFELPFDARGYQKTSSSISNYESINLANGNLVFRVPLASVQTDGGLSYDLSIYHNLRLTFEQEYCGAEICDNPDDFFNATFPYGVESYGIGWEMRPPRLMLEDFNDANGEILWGITYTDQSGASRYLWSQAIWDVDWPTQQPETRGVGGFAAGDVLYTRDGSNLRFRVDAIVGYGDASIPTSVSMEDGQGRVFIFSHIVPFSCDTDFFQDGLQLVPHTDPSSYNFTSDVAGLYLTEIQQGPWAGGIPANTIGLDYDQEGLAWNAAQCGATSEKPWNLVKISASGEAGRYIGLDYDEDGIIQKVTKPHFNPTFGDDEMSVDPPDEISFLMETAKFIQLNPGTFEPEGKFLKEISWVTDDQIKLSRFQFNSEAAAGHVYWLTNLESVSFPSGATAVYNVSNDVVLGYGHITKTRGENGWRDCGVNVPDPNPPYPEPPTIPNKAKKVPGLIERTYSYYDASGTPATQTTAFLYFLNCSTNEYFMSSDVDLAPWPYDFSYALSPDLPQQQLNAYALTFVYEPYIDAPSQGPFAGKAEIHRFDLKRYEEFSTDYLFGNDELFNEYLDMWMAYDSTLKSELPNFGDEATALADETVIRHEEIEKVRKFFADSQYYSPSYDQYTFEKERRIYTNEQTDNASVTACYSPVDPDATPCTIVSTERDVDDYLNPLTTTLETANNVLSLPVTRTSRSSFLSDETNWLLSQQTFYGICDTAEALCACPGPNCESTNYHWQDLPGSAGTRVFPVITESVINPVGENNYSCSGADCIKTVHGYDNSLGLQNSEQRSGGFNASGLPGSAPVLRTRYRHGQPTKKWLETSNPSDFLLIWEREIDPGTGLSRWQLGGNGTGSAFSYDEMGRATDMAPIEADVTSDPDNGTPIVSWENGEPTFDWENLTVSPLLGTHIAYYPPVVDTQGVSHLRHHDAYDAAYSITNRLQRDSQPTPVLRSSYYFDGLGRNTQVVERMPGINQYRTKFSLHRFAYDAVCPVPTNDPATVSTIGTSSEWLQITMGDGWEQSDSWPADACTTLHWASSLEDPLGRPVKTVALDGSEATFAYRGDVWTKSSRDVATGADGASQTLDTININDALGRTREVTEDRTFDPDTQITTSVTSTYGYDLNDRLISVDIGTQPTRTFSYSKTGFLISSTEPERVSSYSRYDALGNLRASTVDGVNMVFVSDDFGRTITTEIDGVETQAITYGPSLGSSSYNRVTSTLQKNLYDDNTTSVAVTSSWKYDGPAGRVSDKTLNIDDLGTFTQGFDHSYSYDQWGNVSSIDYPHFDDCRASLWNGVDYEYDRSWLTKVSLRASSSIPTVAEYAYYPTGRISKTTYGNGFAWLEEGADTWGMARPAQIDLKFFSEPTTIPIGDYEYDGSGNIWQDGVKNYQYDGLNRLTAFDYNDSETLVSVDYEFDIWGNIDSIIQDGVHIDFSASSTTNRLQSMGGNTFTWNRGNIEKIEGAGALREKEFEFSAEDRLMESIDDPNGIPSRMRYAYDAAGERVARWWMNGDDLEARFYVRNEAGQVLSEWMHRPDSFDVYRDHIFGVSGQVAQISYDLTTDLVYIAADHLGSARIEFNESGTLFKEMDYYPFGILLDNSDLYPKTDLLFTGHERDQGTASSELDYMHARYYSPVLARFVSVDPVMGSVGGSQSWNRYSYVENNPIKAIDPNGEDLHMVYHFGGSNISPRMQNQIVQAVRGEFRRAGVDVVKSYYSGDSLPGEKELRDFDQIVHLNFTTKSLGGGVHGKNNMVGANLTNHGTVSSNNVRNYTNLQRIMNYLVNVALHEANHAARLMTEYDGDSNGLGHGGPSGSPTEQGVSTSDYAQGVRPFSPSEGNRFQTLLNAPAGDTQAWVQQKKDEMAEARRRKVDRIYE